MLSGAEMPLVVRICEREETIISGFCLKLVCKTKMDSNQIGRGTVILTPDLRRSFNMELRPSK